MIYTDGNYLIADSVRELQGFAKQIGLPPEYLNGASFFPYYYIPEASKKQVLEADVTLVTVERLRLIALEVYRP